MPVPVRTLLLAMGRTDRAVHVQHDLLQPLAVLEAVKPLAVQIGQRCPVLGQRQSLRLEPPHLRRRGALLHRVPCSKSPPYPLYSCDFDGFGHTECGEGVAAADGHGGFGDPGAAVAGPQVGADDGFGAGHQGFGAGSSMGAGLDFPRLDPDLMDAADSIAAGLWGVPFLRG